MVATPDIDQDTKKDNRLNLYDNIGKYGLPASFLVGCTVYLVVGMWNVYK
jgi:hypothetical protein